MEQTLVLILKKFELYFMGASMGRVICKSQRFYWPTYALGRSGEHTKNVVVLSPPFHFFHLTSAMLSDGRGRLSGNSKKQRDERD